MKRTAASIICASLLLSFLAAAAWAESPEREDLSSLAHHNNAFAIDLYRQLSQQEGNIFFSPYSISVALAMTHAGARGRTAGEMEKTLHFTLKADSLNKTFRKLINSMNARGKTGKYTLAVANRLWGDKKTRFLKSFLDETEKFFNAPLEQLDFQKETEKSRIAINKWVEKMTHDRIRDLLQKGIIEESTRLVLTNAIYFKGDWRTQFDKARTAKKPFHLTESAKTDVDMMQLEENFSYGRVKDSAVLELPYKGGELSMIIVLPDKLQGIRALEKSLTIEGLEKMTSHLSSAKVNVSLPRFKTTRTCMLKEALQKMGMVAAFDGSNADFSAMTGRRDLCISAVIHQAFVEVDEKGTEAAAATAVVMKPTSVEAPVKPVIFRADHPFLFYIRDNSTGSILFLGRIADPTR